VDTKIASEIEQSKRLVERRDSVNLQIEIWIYTLNQQLDQIEAAMAKLRRQLEEMHKLNHKRNGGQN